MGIFNYFTKTAKAINRTNTFKNAQRGLNQSSRTASRFGKTFKRTFTGEGEMMKLYTRLRSYYTTRDVNGLAMYIDYIRRYQPGYGGAKNQKKRELEEYGMILLDALEGEDIYNAATQLNSKVNTRHEIGRKIQRNLDELLVNYSNNTNSVNINSYSGPMGVYNRNYGVGRRRRTRRN
jgi:hypothetical protein